MLMVMTASATSTPQQFLFEPLPRAKYGTDPQSDSVTGFIGSPAIGNEPNSAWVLSKYL